MKGEILEYTSGDYFCAGSVGYGRMAYSLNIIKIGGVKLITIITNPDQLSRLQAKSNHYLSKLHSSAAGRCKTVEVNRALNQAHKKEAADATNIDDLQEKHLTNNITTN